jgi:DNA anti-recombination protein RmuC
LCASTANMSRPGYLQAVWSSLNNKLYKFSEEYEPGGVHLQHIVKNYNESNENSKTKLTYQHKSVEFVKKIL